MKNSSIQYLRSPKIPATTLPFSPVAVVGHFIFFFVLGGLQAQEILIKPYVQPGDGSSLEGADVKVIAWMTSEPAADFVVEYGISKINEHQAKVSSTRILVSESQGYLLYRALLEGLPFDSRIRYRVKQKENLIRESSFSTRSKGKGPLKFVVVGDVAKNDPAHKKIAYQMAKAEPGFGFFVGDIVYSSGRLSEYLQRFAGPFINVEKPSLEEGAPLLSSVPFYCVIGNHDINTSEKFKDGLAAFYLWHSPLNGPKETPQIHNLKETVYQVDNFRAASGANFPGLLNYSFENGPAHFLVLDANAHINVADPNWRGWIEKDLQETKACWKLVFFHQPAFHSSKKHYAEQRMRAREPIFEKCGVDVVFCGHVHNYQRSKPLKFTPAEKVENMVLRMTTPVTSINGTFELDEEFDGISKTTPHGIIHIVTGAGGGGLYDSELSNKPELWTHEPENWAPFTTKFISDKYSFTEVTLDSETLILRQIDSEGVEIDKMKITKAP